MPHLGHKQECTPMRKTEEGLSKSCPHEQNKYSPALLTCLTAESHQIQALRSLLSPLEAQAGSTVQKTDEDGAEQP